MRSILTALFCLTVLVFGQFVRAEVGVKPTDQGVEVTIDGQPFTTYIFNSGFKPILWPVIGPTGKEMTRAWPLRTGNPDEKTDHVHQKSFWFDHGNVNGVDFWAETAADPNSEKSKKDSEAAKAAGKTPPERLWQGKQVHKELIKAEGGKVGTVITKTDWVDIHHGPTTLLSDVRTLRFGGDKDKRWVDFDVVVTAEQDGVTFRDTKEGSFGIRVPESMKVERKTGGKIITSEGKSDEQAWGQPASWVDYHGPVEGEKLGIAILNHPTSFRYPAHWHVRPYGLFAANQWGLNDFTKGKERSDHTMKKGESFTLRYRVIFHKGDEKKGKIADAFAAYTKE